MSGARRRSWAEILWDSVALPVGLPPILDLDYFADGMERAAEAVREESEDGGEPQR